MFPKLAKVPEDVPLWGQLLQLVPSVVLSLCGCCIFLGLPEALYWHLSRDTDGGVYHLPFYLLAGGLLSTALVDFLGLQPALVHFRGVLSGLPPLFFAASAFHTAGARSTFLALAAVAQAWSVMATLGGPSHSRSRQVSGWGVMLAIVALPMLTWQTNGINPFLADAQAKLVLGAAGVVSAILGALNCGPCGAAERHSEEDWAASCCGARWDCGSWPAAAAAGLMCASALATFQAVSSSLQEPTLFAFADPPAWMGLCTMGALALGAFAVSAVWCMTPWWLDTCQAALVVGGLPLIGGAMTCAGGPDYDVIGSVRGSGGIAFTGLLLITLCFPFMLAMLSKELGLLVQSRAAGRALLLAGVLSAGNFLLYLVMSDGGSAPLWGRAGLSGELWLFTFTQGVAWCLGVFGAPNGASRPSVHDQWYLSRHSGPPKRGHSAGALLLLTALMVGFFLLAVPMHFTSEGVQGPADPGLLVVAGYNANQGLDSAGWSNIGCVTTLLAGAGADLVGLSNANPPRMVAASANPTVAYAAGLQMHSFRGVPSALSSPDGAVLSRLPFNKTDVTVFEALDGCERCPTRRHLWQRTTVMWDGAPLEFHNLRIAALTDPMQQVEYVAEQIRTQHRFGPLILVASIGSAASAELVQPASTVVGEMVRGTGLREAFGVLNSNTSAPIAPKEASMHSDYLFYREVEMTGKWAHPHLECSEQVLMAASFRRIAQTSDGRGVQAEPSTVQAEPPTIGAIP